MEYTDRLKLPLLIPNQSGKEVTHNEAMVIIDNLLQNHVIDNTLNVPPEKVNNGDMYIVAEVASEDWLNKEKYIAIFDNGWRFIKPINGMLFFVLKDETFYIYNNSWIKLENILDFLKLKNLNFNTLQENDLIKYSNGYFINTKNINIQELIINNELKIDSNLNLSIKNNDTWESLISINNEAINFKNNLQINNIDLETYIENKINSESGKANTDLSNLSTTGQTYIKSLVDENVLNRDIDNLTATGISNLQNYLIPDYNSTIDFKNTIDNNTVTYTAPNNGVINISAQSTGPGSITIQAIINDIVIGQSTFNGGTPILNGQYIIGKNDIFKVTITGGTFYLPIASFTPFKDNN